MLKGKCWSPLRSESSWLEWSLDKAKGDKEKKKVLWIVLTCYTEFGAGAYNLSVPSDKARINLD